MWTSLDPGAVVGITQENGPFAVNHFAFPWNLNLYIYYTILYHTVYITASSEMHSVWNVNLRIFLNIRDRLIYSKHMFCLFSELQPDPHHTQRQTTSMVLDWRT